MRLPYVADPPPASTPENDAIVSRIRDRRHPRPLQPLDLTLLHSPPVADGWNSFLGAVRTRTLLPADLREIAISRVAVVNRAWYEWAHHAPLAVAGGVTEQGMDALKTEGPLVWGETERPAGLSEIQWVVACFTDEMTRNVQVRDETFEGLRRAMKQSRGGGGGEKEETQEDVGEEEEANRLVVEVVATVACYNCVSRFLVALDVGERNGTGPDAVH